MSTDSRWMSNMTAGLVATVLGGLILAYVLRDSTDAAPATSTVSDTSAAATPREAPGDAATSSTSAPTGTASTSTTSPAGETTGARQTPLANAANSTAPVVEANGTSSYQRFVAYLKAAGSLSEDAMADQFAYPVTSYYHDPNVDEARVRSDTRQFASKLTRFDLWPEQDVVDENMINGLTEVRGTYCFVKYVGAQISDKGRIFLTIKVDSASKIRVIDEVPRDGHC